MVGSLAPLRHPPFRRLWIGQTVSQFGDAVYGLTFMYMTDRLTQSPQVVGLVVALLALPYLVLSPLAGVIADRLDRRFLMVGSDVASTVILLAFLAYVLAVPTPHVAVIAIAGLLLSCVNVFFMPARGAAIPRLVPPEDVLAATALSSATANLMATVGLGLSALFLGVIESLAPAMFFPLAIGLNAVSFLVSASFLARLPMLRPERGGDGKMRVGAETREGLRVILRDPVLRVAIPLTLFVSLLVAGFYVVYLATNREWFDGRFATVAWVEFAFFGSMVLGSLWVGRLGIRRVGVAIALGLAAVGVLIAAMAGGQVYAVYIVLNILCGIVLPLTNIPLSAYVGLAVPDAVRGRVSSVLAMTSVGVQPLGAAVTGFLLAWLGITGIYLAMGVSIVIAALLALLNRPYRESVLPDAEPVSVQSRADEPDRVE